MISLQSRERIWPEWHAYTRLDLEIFLRIWHYDPNTGSIMAGSYTPATPRIAAIGELQIVWDEEIRERSCSQRESICPMRQGAYVSGYFDLVLRKVFIVDVLAAPPDSRGDPTGFVRGIHGLGGCRQKS